MADQLPKELELDPEWLLLRHLVRDAMKRDTLHDLNAIPPLVGIEELGCWKSQFTKEEKQDLMHIAVCRLLGYDGFFRVRGRRLRRVAALQCPQAICREVRTGAGGVFENKSYPSFSDMLILDKIRFQISKILTCDRSVIEV